MEFPAWINDFWWSLLQVESEINEILVVILLLIMKFFSHSFLVLTVYHLKNNHPRYVILSMIIDYWSTTLAISFYE